MTVAVIVAHPDDETLGCGGSIARLAGAEDVHVVILAEGITARKASKHDRRAVEQLNEDAQAAAAVLGVTSVTFERLPDLRLDTVPLLEIVWRVESAINRLRPQVIYTHHSGDLNKDHELTARAVLTATRPVDNQPVQEIYAFETPSSTDWTFGRMGPAFRPNVFVDISTTLETKIEAMQAYRSERRDFPHPRSAKALRATAVRWGSVVGLPAVEAFELVRSIRNTPLSPGPVPRRDRPTASDDGATLSAEGEQ